MSLRQLKLIGAVAIGSTLLLCGSTFAQTSSDTAPGTSTTTTTTTTQSTTTTDSPSQSGTTQSGTMQSGTMQSGDTQSGDTQSGDTTAMASKDPDMAYVQGAGFGKPEAALVYVLNQPVTDGKVFLNQVDSPAVGYVVIHENEGGFPGAILGYVPVDAGTNLNVSVPISRLPKDGRALAVVHTGRTTSRNANINTLGRFDPVTYPMARAGNKQAMATFQILTGSAMAGTTGTPVSSTTYQRSQTTITPAEPPSDTMDRSTSPSTTTPDTTRPDTTSPSTPPTTRPE